MSEMFMCFEPPEGYALMGLGMQFEGSYVTAINYDSWTFKLADGRVSTMPKKIYLARLKIEKKERP